MKIKTIDNQVKTWVDKTFGNTYFSSRITLNFGMKDQKEFRVPFEYGYSSFDFKAFDIISKNSENLTPQNVRDLVRNKDIIYRENINPSKRIEVKAWGE